MIGGCGRLCTLFALVWLSFAWGIEIYPQETEGESHQDARNSATEAPSESLSGPLASNEFDHPALDTFYASYEKECCVCKDTLDCTENVPVVCSCKTPTCQSCVLSMAAADTTSRGRRCPGCRHSWPKRHIQGRNLGLMEHIRRSKGDPAPPQPEESTNVRTGEEEARYQEDQALARRDYTRLHLMTLLNAYRKRCNHLVTAILGQIDRLDIDDPQIRSFVQLAIQRDDSPVLELIAQKGIDTSSASLEEPHPDTFSESESSSDSEEVEEEENAILPLFIPIDLQGSPFTYLTFQPWVMQPGIYRFSSTGIELMAPAPIPIVLARRLDHEEGGYEGDHDGARNFDTSSDLMDDYASESDNGDD
jgi:hypothetical protein